MMIYSDNREMAIIPFFFALSNSKSNSKFLNFENPISRFTFCLI